MLVRGELLAFGGEWAVRVLEGWVYNTGRGIGRVCTGPHHAQHRADGLAAQGPLTSNGAIDAQKIRDTSAVLARGH